MALIGPMPSVIAWIQDQITTGRGFHVESHEQQELKSILWFKHYLQIKCPQTAVGVNLC